MVIIFSVLDIYDDKPLAQWLIGTNLYSCSGICRVEIEEKITQVYII